MQNTLFINTADKAVLCPMTDFELLFCQALSQHSYTWSLVSNFYLVLGWNNFLVGLPTGMEFIQSVGNFESNSDMPLLSLIFCFIWCRWTIIFLNNIKFTNHISLKQKDFSNLMTFGYWKLSLVLCIIWVTKYTYFGKFGLKWSKMAYHHW